MLDQAYGSTRNGALAESSKRNPEVASEMSRINECVAILEKRIEEHQQRIAGILRQEPARENIGATAIASEHRSSPVGESLQQVRFRIERMTGMINAITALVEL